METEKMGVLYQKIAEQINEIIPSEWEKVALYAEILDDSSEVYFFFTIPQNQEYIYSHDIPEHFNVNEDIYDELLYELHDYFEELRNEFKTNNEDLWTNLTLHLERSGKFSIDYDYTDVIASDLNGTQRQVAWEYKNLGILPEDEEDKQFVINYFGL
ncbi:antitoxin YezG family protein [Bacillus mojavensis]|uniref:antitoxin YezG family protein n=1 Tax=Bacillus mojavensis TaxID=72360 RepID=UPI002DB6C28C|nr:antitoxin YezG family protein [Bacillus mojavensis]MEC1748396.1 antitoxin YezG family protein [Bacillus mojavensis]